MATARWDIPHGFHHTTTDGDVLIPAIHHDILLTAVQQKLIAQLERRTALGAQQDMLGMERLDADAWHALYLRQDPSWSRQRPHPDVADGHSWPWGADDRAQDLGGDPELVHVAVGVGHEGVRAAFHLGDGTAQNGSRLLTNESLVAMRSNPGPGGTLVVELDGMGVTWMLRPSAEGMRIVQHGGIWAGQHLGFVMVPERGFALTMLTNSDGGPQLLKELFYDDWALRRFAGVSNLPAEPRALTQAELAPFEGRYTAEIIDESGAVTRMEVDLTGDNGRLNMTQKMRSVEQDVLDDPTDIEETEDSSPAQEFSLAFYRDDYVLVYDESGEPTFSRANFLRGADGGVAWLRFRGRLFRHQGSAIGRPRVGLRLHHNGSL